jgi:glutathione reductase (NADPH)
MAYDYDLFTVGAGSGGVRRAGSGTPGAKVAVAEEALLGGNLCDVGAS